MDEGRTHGVDDSGIQRQLDKRPCVGRDHLQKRPGGRCEGVETLRGEGLFYLAAVELKQMRSQDSRGPIEVPGLQICVQHCRELLGGESLCDGLQTMEHIGSGKEVGQWLGAHAFSFTTGSPSKRRKGRWTQRGDFPASVNVHTLCSHPCAPPAAHHVRGLSHFLAYLQHYTCCCDFMKASKHAFNNSLNFISLLAAVTLNALTNSRGILNCMGTSSADGTTPRWRVALCEWGFTGVRSVPSRAWVLAMASFPFFP